MTAVALSPASARGTMSRRASSFAVAARLLPEDVRDDIELLYAMFRRLDDLVDDGEPDAESRVAAVQAWADGVGLQDTPEVAVLATLDARRDLPRGAIADFCAGMREDVEGPRIVTDSDLDRYCYRVAGTVGVVMAAMLGVRAPAEAYGCAAELGMAMQLTNILRDVDEDAAAGRVYVPGLADGDRAGAVRRQIARADALYDDGLLGVALLRRGRAAITLAAGLYREILRELERTGAGGGAEVVRITAGRRAATALRLVLTGR